MKIRMTVELELENENSEQTMDNMISLYKKYNLMNDLELHGETKIGNVEIKEIYFNRKI